jgi:nucleoside-diphosphate-sugar epimerase
VNVLITGACGRIGRALTEVLGAHHALRLLDRVTPAEATVVAGKGRVHRPFKTDWPFIRAEITDQKALLAAMDSVDAVVHLAGHLTGHPEEGVDAFRSNALGTFVALDAARQTGVQRILCASSICAFGTFYYRMSGEPAPYQSMPLTEDFLPVPEDPYSLSKLVAEHTCAAFSRAYPITAIALRFASVVHEERYERVRSKGLAPTEEWRDDLYQWVHIADIAEGICLALQAPNLPPFAVYTLSAADTRCPEPTMEILERFRPDLAARVTAPLEGRSSLLSIDRARRAFGYDPCHRFGP